MQALWCPGCQGHHLASLDLRLEGLAMKRYKPGARVMHRKFGWKGTVIKVDQGWLVAVAVDWGGMTGYHGKDELRLLP